MNYPKTIQTLIECFKKLPGIGEKTAERLSLYTLQMDEEVLNIFSESLLNVQKKIKRCKKCNHLTEEDICDICKDKTRDFKTICVVEDPKNIITIEKIGKYNGVYHVLNGLISPIDGITPEDILLDKLVDRINNEKIKEVILAVKPSIEGETTTLYISRVLSGMDVKVTKIAHGVPLGAEMEYVDLMTLETALDNRIEVS